MAESICDVITTEITLRARVWGRIQTVRCYVDADGTVRVWDEIAGHYTLCHDLSASGTRRAIAMARAER